MLAFSNDYYGFIFRATQSVELFCAYLKSNYIPLYYMKYDSKNLYADNYIVVEDFYKDTLKEEVLYKIRNLSENVIDFQVHLIMLSMFVAQKDAFIGKNKMYSIYNSETPLISAKKILETIIKYKTYNTNTGKEDILINRLLFDSQVISSIDYSLYEGGGMLWFIACMGNELGRSDLKELVCNIFDSRFSIYEANKAEAKLATYQGKGSLLYLSYNFFKLYGEKKYFDNCMRVLADIKESLIDSNPIYTDYLNGVLGIPVMLNKMYSIPMDVRKEVTQLIGEKIKFSKDTEKFQIGLAHGYSGKALALASIEKVDGKGLYIKDIFKLLVEERKYIDDNKKEVDVTWCRGLSGIILSRIEIKKCLNDLNILELIDSDIHYYLEILLKTPVNYAKSLCLCHGIYGNLDVLRVISNLDFLNQDEEEKIQKRLSYITKFIGKEELLDMGIKNNLQLQTFMLGSSGVGYALLRAHNEKYPSILNLDVLV